MLPNINSQNEIIQYNLKTPSHYVSSQIIDIQSKAQQESKKQQSQENGSVEELDIDEVDTKKTKFRTSNITSSPTGSPSGSTGNTGQQDVVRPIIETNNEEINLAAKTLATTMGIEPIEGNINKEVEVESDNSIYDDIYEKRKIKPRWPIISSDTNYKKDKGGNHHMTLIYNSDSNDVRFSKDDDPVIVIENDNVKNEGDYWRLVAEIEEKCEQKTDKGEKYYYEDYLKDKGFMKEQKEEKIDISEKLDKIMSLIINKSSLEIQ